MKNRLQHSGKNRAQQGADTTQSDPYSIGAATPYDFDGKNLTAYGGLLPVATMLERLGFQQLIEETLTVKRLTRAMSMYQFVLSMVLAVYVGFSRLHHLRFVTREPMLTGILKVLRLPPLCTFWRFLASLHLGIAKQLLSVQRQMREREWRAAPAGFEGPRCLASRWGGRKGYNPRNKGKKSFQPILTFLAETREYISGELHNGDRPTGPEIARHLEGVFEALPAQMESRLSGQASRHSEVRQLRSSCRETRYRSICPLGVCPQSSAK